MIRGTGVSERDPTTPVTGVYALVVTFDAS